MQLTRSRGDTAPDELVVSNASGAVNLTGCTAVLTLNTQMNPVSTATEVYQIEGVIDNPTTGVIQFSPTEEQADLVGYFYYDIQLTEANGAVRTLVKDLYEYTQDITKN